jgi:hypothetical protein
MKGRFVGEKILGIAFDDFSIQIPAYDLYLFHGFAFPFSQSRINRSGWIPFPVKRIQIPFYKPFPGPSNHFANRESALPMPLQGDKKDEIISFLTRSGR